MTPDGVIGHSARPPDECEWYRPGLRIAEFEACFHLLISTMFSGLPPGVDPPDSPSSPLAACVVVDESDPVARLNWVHAHGGRGTHHHVCADCYRQVFGTE